MYAGRTAAALLALACDPVGSMRDAGGGDEDAPAGSGVVELRLSANDDEPMGDWQLEEAIVSLVEARVDNDRGGTLEPIWSMPGALRLDEGGSGQRLEAVPATYGGVSLAAAGFDVTLRLHDARVRVVSDRAIAELSLRCAAGAVVLREGGEVRMEASVRTAPIAGLLPETEPPAVVDRESDPALLADVEAAFEDAWQLDCDGV